MEGYRGTAPPGTPLHRASSGSSTTTAYPDAPPRTSVLLAVKTAAGGRPPGTASPGAARPMTSNKAAGYSSPTRAGAGAGASPLSPGSPAKPGSAALHAQCGALEERAHALLELAAARAAAGDGPGAVDAAQGAARREQRLCALLEGAGAGDQVSLDLKYAVSVGLGAAYEANGQLAEALAVYDRVLRSRLFPQVGSQGARGAICAAAPPRMAWQEAVVGSGPCCQCPPGSLATQARHADPDAASRACPRPRPHTRPAGCA